MPSPRMTSPSTIMLTIAGLGLALGSAAFTSGHRLHPPFQAPPQAPPNEIPCKTFLAHGVDKNDTVDDAEGKSVTLYRTKGYYEHPSKFPKWVGAVKVKDEDGSKAFPGLGKNERGCLYFQPYAIGADPAYSQLWDEKGERQPYTYKHQLMCQGSPHDSDVVPEWKKTPDDCNTYIQLQLTTTKGFYFKRWAGSSVRAAAVVMQEVEDSLGRMGVPQDEIKRIMAATAAEGPWYPCAESGCCRAYEDQ